MKYKSLRHVSLYMPYTRATVNGIIQILTMNVIKFVFLVILFPPTFIIFDIIIMLIKIYNND